MLGIHRARIESLVALVEHGPMGPDQEKATLCAYYEEWGWATWLHDFLMARPPQP
jgi:hypothetical protein